MLLIMTGTITPMVKDTEIQLKDHNERLQQYVESLLFFIRSKAFDKIIFGENSHFPKEELPQVFQAAEENQVQFEYLTFSGNSEQVYLHGKGYGEGEIMDHVFSNSQLLTGEEAFMKITGRMKVDNISELVSRCKPENIYFNIPNRTIRGWYDTRVYWMPVKQFQKDFQKQYDRVMDSEGTYLEVVYTRILKEKNTRVKNFPRYPRVVGISGSTGSSYVYKEWKCKIKDVFSFFQFYQVK